MLSFGTDVLDDSWAFNLGSWKIHSKYRGFAAPRIFGAKDQSIKAFFDYLSLPKDRGRAGLPSSLK